jgi:hypothetical protein
MSTTANNRSIVANANGYISHLEQLRGIGNPVPTDANTFITHLDQLRQKGQDTAQVTSTEAALP